MASTASAVSHVAIDWLTRSCRKRSLWRIKTLLMTTLQANIQWLILGTAADNLQPFLQVLTLMPFLLDLSAAKYLSIVLCGSVCFLTGHSANYIICCYVVSGCQKQTFVMQNNYAVCCLVVVISQLQLIIHVDRIFNSILLCVQSGCTLSWVTFDNFCRLPAELHEVTKMIVCYAF